MTDIMHHPVVSHEEWLAARKQLLADEKEFTRLRDRLSQRRRDLPWEAVDPEYVVEGPHGRQTLAELFDGRSQLVVYHAMFDPATASPSTPWTVDAACPGCSFWADNFNGILVHLNHRDVTLVAVSRAPYVTIAAYAQRMGWTFTWVSSYPKASLTRGKLTLNLKFLKLNVLAAPNPTLATVNPSTRSISPPWK